MWYCSGMDEVDLDLPGEECTKQNTEPLKHKWGKIAPVAYGGATVAHLATCKACGAQGKRCNPSKKAGKGYTRAEPWCPETCPGVKTDWARAQREWFRTHPECDPRKRSVHNPLCVYHSNKEASDKGDATNTTTTGFTAHETMEATVTRLLGI